MKNNFLLNKDKNKLRKNEFIKLIQVLIIIGLLSFLIMSITFIYSSASFNSILLKSYFSGRWLMLMNFIPIFLLMIFLSLLTNRLWISFSLSGIIFFVMSIINKYKLVYRDETFTFTDVKLITESIDMAQKYKIGLSFDKIIIILGIIAITIILKLFVPYKITSKKNRFLLLTTIVLIGLIITKGFYFNPTIYNRVGNKDIINVWSETQQFQSKGFVYPFIYSVEKAGDRVLEGYDEEKAINILNEKSYNNIIENQKVNVIAIMLEAYNDFSKFKDVDLNVDVYENFHRIQGESYSGRLVTNVFGGGTINTEWSFLTGYNSHPQYLKDTNSFLWYFKEQGYRTEAMHPNYGWFYNRRNVNNYIGFDKYDYYENKYQAVQEDFLKDYDFFDYIIQGYEESKANDIPYFNFSVTYQNHGPYSDNKISDIDYLMKKPNYDEKTYNIINNYLSGIKETDEALEKLINYFNKQEEPTIVILFGDHNPWLGEDAVGYNMMGIDIDLSNAEGFLNYYETPYIFWGNQKAKEVLDKDFSGSGSNISPNFLMAELFHYLGWNGNEYMEYINHVKQEFSVNHDMYFNDNGQYIRKLDGDKLQTWKDFNSVQYYYSRNFKSLNLSIAK